MNIDLDKVPEGWAVRTENGRTEFVLCLFAPTLEDAERMSREEAQRHVLDFAGAIATWLHGDWKTKSPAREQWEQEMQRAKYHCECGSEFPGERPHFEEWCATQILAMAKGERPCR